MKKRMLVTLCALLLTAALVWVFPRAVRRKEMESVKTARVRVWITEEEGAVVRWAQRQAAAYEKQTKCRVYLRRAEAGETADALQGAAGAVAPDLLLGPQGDRPAALRGYALIVRDDQAPSVTPAPTSALFFRPSPSVGPALTQAPPPDLAQIGAVLAPGALVGAVPGTVESEDPVQEFAQGKARAALLTGGQAARLTVGFRAFAVPEGRGLLPVGSRAFSSEGEAFLSFLLAPVAQADLAACGLYALQERLYPASDPVRFLIDGSRLP